MNAILLIYLTLQVKNNIYIKFLKQSLFVQLVLLMNPWKPDKTIGIGISSDMNTLVIQ